MMRRRLLGMVLALAGAALPEVGSAQVDATIGGTQAVPLPFDAVTPNPTGIKMYYYVPAVTAGTSYPLPIVVGLHGCQGNQTQVMGFLKSAADTYKFMLAIPFANRVDQSTPAGATTPTGCWDVGSEDALENDSSDPAGIAALVNYVGTTLRCDGNPCGDLTKVFATGQSSGAMMTNVLLGLYPDLFKAGASYMGVPFGCWASGVAAAHPAPGTETTLGAAAGWSGACANGTVLHTPAEWAALLPAYDGIWPRMQIIHGAQDTLINYVNFAEQIDQWTAIHGLTTTPDATDHPVAPAGRVWTRTRYGGTGPQATVEAISISGMGHSAPVAEVAPEIIRFFGLGDSTPPSAPTTVTADDVTSSGARLSWSGATDEVGVNNYVVYRVNGETSTPVAWPTATTYALTGLSAETVYTYEVVAVDRAGNLSASTSAQFTTASPSGGGGGCSQGAPSAAALILAGALLLVRRRASRA